MNRKKKVKDTIKKWTKRANAKSRLKNKPRYISKAEREKLALSEGAELGTESVAEENPESGGETDAS